MDNLLNPKNLLGIGAVGLCALASYGGFANYYPLITPLALLLWPLGLRLAQTRSQCYMANLAFFLVGNRGLVAGVEKMLSEAALITAIATWLLVSATLALIGLVMPRKRYGFSLAMLLLLIPPLGLIASPTPFILAGHLLPGLGVIGVVLVIICYQTIYTGSKYQTTTLITLMIIGVCYNAIATPIPLNHTPLSALSLNLGNQISTDRKLIEPSLALFEYGLVEKAVVAATAAISSKQNRSETIMVLPESTAGQIDRINTEALTRLAKRAQTRLIVGGEIKTRRGLQNILLLVDSHSTKVVYRQRLPAPYFMWRGNNAPNSYTADLLRPTSFRVDGYTVGNLICYEIPLLYLVLTVHWINDPDIVIAASNLWWAKHTNIPGMMANHTLAWSRLFGVPYIYTVNL